ncbi:hypothetical protein V2J09_006570 [Rumex salicifolius]
MADVFANLVPILFLFGFLLLSGVESSHDGRGSRENKPRLFVFGDSFADTGNINKSIGAGSWKVPYGITFPGKPSGRFSDGRILTDFIAKFLGLKSPIPYSWRKEAPLKAKHGVNFAFGGTGVTNTSATIVAGLPNMTSQIDLFHQMLSGNDVVHIEPNLSDAIAYVSVVGNDYAAFLASGGTVQEMPSFIAKVVKQLALNLQTILGLGIRRILVTGMQPLGCTPQITATNSFQHCNSTFNSGVQHHNALLQQAVSKLNNQSDAIYILDLYNSFFTAFQEKEDSSGGLRFEHPLKPCCFGTSSSSNCGDVDENGNKLYTLCDDRTNAFYWDKNHPTQEGWKVLYPKLKATIKKAVQ